MATDDYMIGKPFPYEEFDLAKAIIEDENDEPAPKEWVQKMFPKVFSLPKFLVSPKILPIKNLSSIVGVLKLSIINT